MSFPGNVGVLVTDFDNTITVGDTIMSLINALAADVGQACHRQPHISVFQMFIAAARSNINDRAIFQSLPIVQIASMLVILWRVGCLLLCS